MPQSSSATSNVTNAAGNQAANQVRVNTFCVAQANIQQALPMANNTAVARAPTPVSSAATFIQAPGLQTLQSLGLMVTRFSGERGSQGTVILQRPGTPGMSTVRPSGNVVVTSTPAGARAVSINQLRLATPSAGQPGVITQSHPGSTIQVMNLSVSNPANASQVHQRVPLENIPIRIGVPAGHANIVSVRPSGAVAVQARHQAGIRASTSIPAGTQARVISLAGGTPVSVATSSQQLTRLNLISTGPKQAQMLNIAALGGQKPTVILNPSPASALVSAGGAVHSASFATGAQAGKQTVIPVNQTVMTLTPSSQNSRHTIIQTTSAGVHFGTIQQRPNQTIAVKSQQPSTNTIVASPIKVTSGGGTATVIQASPIKQQQAQTIQSSPRPSILNRKRAVGNIDPAAQSAVAVNLFKTAATTPTKNANEQPSHRHPGVPGTPVSQITKSDAYEVDALDHPQLQQLNCNSSTNGGGSQSSAVPSTAASDGCTTPRKKPRKQNLEPFINNMSTLPLKMLSSSDDSIRCERESFDQDSEETDDAGDDDILDDMASTPYPVSKRPRLSLLGQSPNNNNIAVKSSLQYHFLRYTDVKPKPDKKLLLSDLSNEGLQKKNGWKIHHLATQMEDMSENEAEIHERLSKVLQTFEEKSKTLTELCGPIMSNGSVNSGDETSSSTCSEQYQSICPSKYYLGQVSLADKLVDLIRGNLQRSTLFQEQITESKTLLLKLTQEHRERVGKLTKKCANKRTFITK